MLTIFEREARRRAPKQAQPIRGWSKTTMVDIVNSIPDDGCLLLFNCNSHTVRATAAMTGVLSVHKIQGPSERNGTSVLCDMYVTWKE